MGWLVSHHGQIWDGFSGWAEAGKVEDEPGKGLGLGGGEGPLGLVRVAKSRV